MAEARLDAALAGILLGLALVTFLVLWRVSAPYGRHQRSGWGPNMAARTAWLMMESPACLVFVPVFFAGQHAQDAVPRLLLGLWLLHYGYRALVFPFRLRDRHRRVPVIIALFGLTFQLLNSYLNARYISHFGSYPARWLLEPHAAGGGLLFLLGWAMNQHSDALLLRLRPPGEVGYRVPRGGLFRWVSCPNYLGEILEWSGWALATWSLPGLAFAIFTAANLVPRARAHHRWYKGAFADYPPERRALVPYLW